MKESDFTSKTTTLADMNVAILGLGLMGGSLAMALHGKVRTITGVDPNDSTLKLAEGKKVFDHLAAEVGNNLEFADLIFLAMPVRKIIQTILDLQTIKTGNPIVMDLGSTKVDIMQAMNALPERFDPIGGHPMCGKEKSSFSAADPNLFIDNPFIFTRLDRTSIHACTTANQLAETMLAFPIWLDAATHDRWVASTSHLPYLIASALASCTPLESAQVVGSGYESTSRVSATNPQVMLDVLMTNRENVLTRLRTYQNNLDLFKSALETEDTETLHQLLLQAASHQSLILSSRHQVGRS